MKQFEKKGWWICTFVLTFCMHQFLYTENIEKVIENVDFLNMESSICGCLYCQIWLCQSALDRKIS